jgi:hypothetical protein
MKPKTLALLGAAGAAGYVIYTVHSHRATPGWYWAFVSQRPKDQEAINAWRKENIGKVVVRKTVSPGISRTHDIYFKSNLPSAWILFEAKGPFTWTLPGKPVPAPKGIETQIEDALGKEEVVPAITSPEHPWNKFWGAFWSDGQDGKDPNPILSLWQALGVAGPIIIYGGAGIVLYKLWDALGSTSRSSRASSSPKLLGRG